VPKSNDTIQAAARRLPGLAFKIKLMKVISRMSTSRLEAAHLSIGGRLYRNPTMLVNISSLVRSASTCRRQVRICLGPIQSGVKQTRYGKILADGSSVVYQTDKESLGVGRKFTKIVLSETV